MLGAAAGVLNTDGTVNKKIMVQVRVESRVNSREIELGWSIIPWRNREMVPAGCSSKIQSRRRALVGRNNGSNGVASNELLVPSVYYSNQATASFYRRNENKRGAPDECVVFYLVFSIRRVGFRLFLDRLRARHSSPAFNLKGSFGQVFLEFHGRTTPSRTERPRSPFFPFPLRQLPRLDATRFLRRRRPSLIF